jgi:Zn-dependent peptidase ImmA (M78 family)
MLDDLQREDVVAVVDQMVDAIALAQGHLGMVVCLDKRQAQRGRAQRSGGKAQIFLRPEPTEERHQWTVAHEIGEHMKTELLARLGIEPGQTRAFAGESLANLFAHHLLVPGRWFAADARELNWNLLKLKRRYTTSSHEVIALRFLDLPDLCVVTVIDNDTVNRRRSNGPRITHALHAVEKKCQQIVHTRGKSRRLHADGVTVQGWPVHTADWKREILRTVFDDE